MKMTPYLLSCLLFACLLPLHAQQAPNSQSKSVRATLSSKLLDDQFFIEKEKEVWEALKHRDKAAATRLLADDFVGMYDFGLFQKSDWVKQIDDQYTVDDYAILEPKVLRPSPTTALLLYTSTCKGSGAWKDYCSSTSRISDLWVLRNEHWLDLFSQDTTATSGEQASTQALAKEREIQEAQKQGDWTRFADLLSDDLVAIDEDGIRGKKELLEEIRTSDFHLSDYKMEDIRTIPQGNGVIVVYKQTHVGTQHGKPFALHIYTHSNWQRRGDKWLLTIYQDSTARADSPSTSSEQAEKMRSVPSPQEQQAIREEIIGMERSDWEAAKTKNKAAMERVRADDNFDFGSDGRVEKAKGLTEGWLGADSTLLDFSWQDLQVNFLGNSTALVTYRGKYRGITAGKQDSGEAYYSTLYQKRQGKWLIVFTQDSNLKCAGM